MVISASSRGSEIIHSGPVRVCDMYKSVKLGRLARRESSCGVSNVVPVDFGKVSVRFRIEGGREFGWGITGKERDRLVNLGLFGKIFAKP